VHPVTSSCSQPLTTTAIRTYAEVTNSKNLRMSGGSGLAGIEMAGARGRFGEEREYEFIAAAGKGLRVGTLRAPDKLES